MLTSATLDEVVDGDRGMLAGIRAAVDAQCMVSAVTLCYATVDAVSALTRGATEIETRREIFLTWVDRYLLPESGIDCNALDLYAARCGILHTYRPESRLSVTGDARPIYYQWRGGPQARHTRGIPTGAAVVDVETLVSAVENSVYKFAEDVERDPGLASLVEYHLQDLLCYVPA